MAVLVTTAIPQSNMEIIRNKIAAILATELPAQWLLDNTIPKVERVWVERTIPADATEIPLVIVGIDQATWSEHNQRSAKGEYTFNIDIYNSAVSEGMTTTGSGDVLAMMGLQRLVAIIRGILQAPVYVTLDLPRGTIAGVYVQSAVAGQRNAANGLSPDKDGAHDVVAQIKVMVRSAETNVMLGTAVPLEQATTSVTILTNDLQQSSQGYYYDFNPVQ